jgi:hypothetical protein
MHHDPPTCSFQSPPNEALKYVTAPGSGLACDYGVKHVA